MSQIQQKVEWCLPGAGGDGAGEAVSNESRVSVLQMDGGDGCTTM